MRAWCASTPSARIASVGRFYGGPVIHVCVDSNSLHGDPLWQKTYALRLLDHAAAGRCEIHVSPVVEGELSRQVQDELGGEIDSLRSRIRATADNHRLDCRELIDHLEAFRGAAEQKVAERQVALLGLPGFAVEEWPDVTPEDVVQRELAWRRPFIDTKLGTVGHRDTIIWHGVLEVAKSFPFDQVVLVTKDSGFLGKNGGLHPDLVADLLAAKLDPDNVTQESDVFHAVAMLDRVSAAERLERLTLAVRVALHDYNRELWNLQWAPDFDPQDGGMTDPDIEVGLPPTIENVSVSYIESTFDVRLDPAEPASGETVLCRYQIEIGFDGAMYKNDWFGDDHDDIELWDSDLNDHYVAVHAERRVVIDARVSYDDESDTAEVEEIVGGTRVG